MGWLLSNTHICHLFIEVKLRKASKHVTFVKWQTDRRTLGSRRNSPSFCVTDQNYLGDVLTSATRCGPSAAAKTVHFRRRKCLFHKCVPSNGREPWSCFWCPLFQRGSPFEHYWVRRNYRSKKKSQKYLRVALVSGGQFSSECAKKAGGKMIPNRSMRNPLSRS